ncbi:MAG: MFS transporter [Candidatus Bathyarchaeota archaeon]|jgi:MFS family permease|nr:MFS transporter [Candidatus Bathyarchaeota archaeon]
MEKNHISQPPTVRLWVLAFLAGINVGIWYFLPFYIVDLGGNTIDVGLISTIPSFVAAFIQLSVGEMLDDKLGTAKQLLELGFLFTAIFTLPLLIVSNRYLVIICAAVLETFNSITIIWGVANSMYMVHLTSEHRRARIMSVYSASWFLGNILGSYLAGFLALINWTFVFVVFIGISLSAGGFLKYFLPRDTLNQPRYKQILQNLFTTHRVIDACKQIPAVLRQSSKAFTTFTVGLSIRSIGISMVTPLTSIYLAVVLQASKPLIATLTSINSGSRIVLSPVAGWMADLIGRKKVFLFGLVVMIIYPVLIVLTPDAHLLYPSYLLMGLGWACNQATYLAWQMTLLPSQPGKAMGILNFLNYLSWALGPTLGGILGEYMGIFLGVLAAIIIETIGLSLLIRVPETSAN